jgi:hypothetical protein
MSTQRRPLQDRRIASRINARLRCTFIFEGIEYEAFIQDISLAGAFLSSTFMPPWGVDLSIKLMTSLMEDPLTLEGKIVRRDCKLTERGTVGAFTIRFRHSSPGLVRLISKLINPPK